MSSGMLDRTHSVGARSRRSLIAALALAACARSGGDEERAAFFLTPSSSAPLATLAVDVDAPGRAVPADFLGLSHEWGQAQLLMGDPAIGVNPIYRQLLRNLVPDGGRISLRIGGSTTDRTSEPRASSVTALAALHRDLMARSAGVSFVLGVNIGRSDVALATRQAKVYVQNMPAGSIQAIELGNEPDAFAINGHRPSSYDFDAYMLEWRAFTRSIVAAVPNSPRFMGPSNAGFSGMQLVPSLPATTFGGPEKFAEFLEREADTLAIVSQHAYAGASTRCGDDPQPGTLLLPASSTEDPTLAEPYIAAAEAAGKPYRMAEMNSIACSGEPGVSDAFEAALWLVDILFEYAKRGVAGVNLHSNLWNGVHGWDLHGAFSFDVPEPQYRASNSEVSPPADARFTPQYVLRGVGAPYYGLWFFAHATANRARLLPVSLDTSANLEAWAAFDMARDRVLVTLINKDQAASGSVHVTVPGYSSGSVARLEAPSFRATRGIAFAGQTFDGSRDGKPIGNERREPISGGGDRPFELWVAPASAALLTLAR